MGERDAPGPAPSRRPSFRPGGAFLLRYVLMQLPDLVLISVVLLLLHRWLGLSHVVGAIVVGLWILKCAAFYPLVQRVYRQAPVCRDPDVGSLGVVRDRLAPTGYAAFSGELWRCVLREGDGPIEKGATVRVIRAEGLTLVVEESEPEP